MLAKIRRVVGPLPSLFEQEVAKLHGIAPEKWLRLPGRKRLQMAMDAASNVMGPRNLSAAMWGRCSDAKKAKLLREHVAGKTPEVATKTFLVTARAYVTVPADAEVLVAANGQAVGFVLKGGREVRPALGFDADGTCFITDAQMRRRGLEIVNYADDTGVEACETVASRYPEGRCPDCGEPIPEDAVEGASCANCGHVWW